MHQKSLDEIRYQASQDSRGASGEDIFIEVLATISCLMANQNLKHVDEGCGQGLSQNNNPRPPSANLDLRKAQYLKDGRNSGTLPNWIKFMPYEWDKSFSGIISLPTQKKS